MSDDEIGFEDQLRLEAEEKAGKDDVKTGRVRVDPDGTQYEWDAQKAAWFPKIDADFIAKYQMSYGSDVTTSEDTSVPTSIPTTDATTPSTTDSYQQYWSNLDTNSKEYREWYEYYYGKQAQQNHNPDSSSNNDKEEPDKPMEMSEESTVIDTNENRSDSGNNISTTDIPPAPEDTNSKEYYDWYYKYYGSYSMPSEAVSGEKIGYSEVYWAQYFQFRGQEATEENKGDDKIESSVKDKKSTGGADKKDDDEIKGKGKKRKPPEPPSWFEMSQDRNTNVYVSGLPHDMTDDEYRELMNKYGLIMFDPITRKPKLKLYKDENGVNKGDGRCCYIKAESVELALQIMDGSEVRGHKIYVERAKFEMKGTFDPTKKRRKLTKHEKKKFRDKQEKLFDWRPDKPFGARNKWEKVVILKNVFDPSLFEKDPTQVKVLQKKLETECAKYGDVKKVVIYDRHQEKVAGITFKEASDADICVEAFNGRLFGGRQLSAATWDGKTKYGVEETEEQKEERLKGWEKFLAEGETTDKTDSTNKKSMSDSESATISDSQLATKTDATECGENVALSSGNNEQIKPPDVSCDPTTQPSSGINEHTSDSDEQTMSSSGNGEHTTSPVSVSSEQTKAPCGDDDQTMQSVDSEITPPSGNSETAPPGGNTETTHSGGNTETAPPGGSGKQTKVPCGDETMQSVDSEITPPGGNSEITHPGGNTETAPPGANTETAPPGGNSETSPPGGDSETTHRGGDSETTQSGGNTETSPSSGNSETAPSSGNTEMTPPGGNSETTHPSGSSETTHPSGRSETTHPSGSSETTHPSGSNEQITPPSGNSDTTHPSGNSETTHPSGNNETTHPSGSSETTPCSGSGEQKSVAAESGGMVGVMDVAPVEESVPDDAAASGSTSD